MSLNAQRGARLREERARLGLSQQQIADLVGVRREMWAKYERGAEPGAGPLSKAAIAGLDVPFVLGGMRTELAAGQAEPVIPLDRELLARTVEAITLGLVKAGAVLPDDARDGLQRTAYAVSAATGGKVNREYIDLLLSITVSAYGARQLIP